MQLKNTLFAKRANIILAKICLILILQSAVGVTPVSAQLNYAGKNFFVAVGSPLLFGTGADTRIILTSKHNANVQFRFMNSSVGPAIQNHTVAAGTTTEVILTFSQMYQISTDTYEQIDNHSLQIVSDSNITVHLLKLDGTADDGTEILPVDNQQPFRNYSLFSMPQQGEGSLDQQSYTIVATCDSVLLEIIPAEATFTHPAGIPFYLWMNKGETYQTGIYGNPLQMAGVLYDLSGTRINVLQSSVNVPICIYSCYTSTPVASFIPTPYT